MSAGVLDDVESDSGREPVYMRSHSTYEKDHWQTGHVDRVDQIGAYESYPFDDGPIRSREQIRVDLDGHGHGGASMHDPDENVQVSVFLTAEMARELLEDLERELFDAPREWPDDVDDETAAFFERTIAPFKCENCGTEFRIDSVYSSSSVHGDPSCPMCDADADALERTDAGGRK